MTTYVLRSGWRKDPGFGPLNMPMPIDPAPSLADFEAALAQHLSAIHEDASDLLNPDGTWGPKNDPTHWNVNEPGGTGIAVGYACDDLPAVVVAEAACYKRGQWYDGEHWIRQIRYSLAAWEMTHERLFARRVMVYDSHATGVINLDPATVHLDDPGWVPNTLAQYAAMAHQHPHTGLPWNAREMGWTGYGRAARHKVEQALSPLWGLTLVDTCDLAAIPGTGQLVVDTAWGAHPVPVQYTFHWAILAHAVLCLCFRLQLPVPIWIIDGMNALDAVASTYGGKIPSYCYTVNGVLVAEVSSLQHPDPAQGYWSHLCTCLEKLRPHEGWIQRATKYGAWQALDPQSQRDSMLYRGWTAA